MKYNKLLLTVLSSTMLSAGMPGAFADTYMMNGKPISEKEAQSANLVKDAMQTLERGNVKEALKLAQEASAITPDFYYSAASLGVCQARAGLSDDAIASFRKALSLNPELPDSLWGLGATLQSAGRTAEAVTEFKAFLAKYPSNARASQAKAIIAMLGNSNGNAVTTHNPDDYFDEAIGTNPIRWATDNIPIKIFVNNGEKVHGYHASYLNELHTALKDWEDASQGKVKFVQVDSPEKASIRFSWSDNPSDVSNAAEGGEALLRPLGNTMAAVKLTVLTIDIDQGIHLNDQLIRYICTHELGHALGIAGHSPSPKDIMYSSLPLDYERLKISDRDAKTLQKLYAIDVASIPHSSLTSQGMLSTSDLANSSELVAITEKATAAMNAKDYDKAVAILAEGVEKFPDSASLKHNLGSALNNTGLIAMQSMQFTKALQIFQKALTLKPDSIAAKHNIATVHYNMGLNSMRNSKYSEAEPELKIAIQKCEELNYQDLLAKAASEYATALKQLGKIDASKQVEAKYKVTSR